MKKVFYVFLFIVLTFTMLSSLSSCKKVVDVYYRNTQCLLVDAEHHDPYITVEIDKDGHTKTVNHEAVNYLVFQYEDKTYYLHGAEYYYRYYDKIGQLLNVTLKVKVYDNATSKISIVAVVEGG